MAGAPTLVLCFFLSHVITFLMDAWILYEVMRRSRGEHWMEEKASVLNHEDFSRSFRFSSFREASPQAMQGSYCQSCFSTAVHLVRPFLEKYPEEESFCSGSMHTTPEDEWQLEFQRIMLIKERVHHRQRGLFLAFSEEQSSPQIERGGGGLSGGGELSSLRGIFQREGKERERWRWLVRVVS